MKRLSHNKPRELSGLLRQHGVTPTAQRLQIAKVLFARPAHFSADDVYTAVNASATQVSKATVYNTLGLFVEKKLIREVLVDPSKVFYDSNMTCHHHFYDIDNGELQDIDATGVAVSGLPPLPPGTELDGVHVVVRVRRS